MAGKGLYGQTQGDEKRQAGLAAMDHFLDNHTVEGSVVAELRHLIQCPGLWPVVGVLLETLRIEGHSDTRLTAMYGQASYGTKFC